MPLCPLNFIKKRLMENPGEEYINVSENTPPQFINRLKYIRPFEKETSNILVKVFRRLRYELNLYPRNPRFKNLPTLYMGSGWLGMSSKCLSFILNYVDTHLDFYEAFEYALCGDELFIQTIVMNSPFRTNVSAKGIMYVNWEADSSHPKLLDENDFEALKEAAKHNYLFARKFTDEIKIERYRSEVLLGFDEFKNKL